MDSKTFNTTPVSLQALQTILATHGVTADLTTPSGHAQDDGWEIGWSTPAPGKTAFTVFKHPFAEEGFLWSYLGGVLGKPI